jgi:hypothetical protein
LKRRIGSGCTYLTLQDFKRDIAPLVDPSTRTPFAQFPRVKALLFFLLLLFQISVLVTYFNHI